MPLGVTGVTLRELVSAYSVFPALGQQAPLHLVREIRDERGKTIYKADEKTRKVCDPPLAWLIHDLLRGVVLRGTASRLPDDGLDHVAGKTGTTSDYRDAWFIGYAPDLITGLWLGSDSGRPLRLSAAEAAVPVWASYMNKLPLSNADIPPPNGVVFRDVDPSNGGLWEPGCSGPVREAFLEGAEPTPGCRGESIRIPPQVAFSRGNPEPPAIDEQKARDWVNQLLNGEGQQTAPIETRPVVIVRPHGRFPEIVIEETHEDHKGKKWKSHKGKKGRR